MSTQHYIIVTTGSMVVVILAHATKRHCRKIVGKMSKKCREFVYRFKMSNRDVFEFDMFFVIFCRTDIFAEDILAEAHKRKMSVRQKNGKKHVEFKNVRSSGKP